MMVDSVNVVRHNRSLLKKLKFKDIKKLFIEVSCKTKLEFKQVSTIELAKIKDRIRKDVQKTKRKEIIVYGSCAVILLSLAGFFFISLLQ